MIGCYDYCAFHGVDHKEIRLIVGPASLSGFGPALQVINEMSATGAKQMR